MRAFVGKLISSLLFACLIQASLVPGQANARARFCYYDKNGKEHCFISNTPCKHQTVDDLLKKWHANSGGCEPLSIAAIGTEVGRGLNMTLFCSPADTSRNHVEVVNLGSELTPDLRLYFVARDNSGRLVNTQELFNLTQAEFAYNIYLSVETTNHTDWLGAAIGNPDLPTQFPPDSIMIQIVRTDLLNDTFVSEITYQVPTPIPPAPIYALKWGTSGAANGQFNAPAGLAIDVSGNVYVADHLNHRVEKFTSTGTYLSQLGTTGVPSGSSGQFQNPNGVAVDRSGNVFVVDQNNQRVQKFDAAGNYLTKWGSYGTGTSQFRFPVRIAADSSGNVYVTDTQNSRVQKFDNNGTYLTQWGTPGSGDGQFSTPDGVAVDGAGNVFVVDTGNNRVQKFTSTGVYLFQFGSTGAYDGEFTAPYGLTVDGPGNVYITEITNNRVQKFTNAGAYITQWGTLGSGNGQFNVPIDVALDAAGDVLVSDQANNRVQEFAPGTPPLPLSVPMFRPATDLSLSAFPNPGSGQTWVDFRLPSAGPVSLAVYDVSGRQLQQWAWASMTAGQHRVPWDGRTSDGSVVPAGVLFYRLQSGGQTLKQKLIHLR